MNKTFKVIFSKTRGALVAVNEAAKTTSRASVKTAVAGVCAALLSVPAMAEGFTDYCKDGNCVVDALDVILPFATPSTFHGVAKHAIFAGVQRQRRSAPAEQGAQHL